MKAIRVILAVTTVIIMLSGCKSQPTPNLIKKGLKPDGCAG